MDGPKQIYYLTKVQKHMFRLKSKSSTADRGVPAQVGFNFNTVIVSANDITIMLSSSLCYYVNIVIVPPSPWRSTTSRASSPDTTSASSGRRVKGTVGLILIFLNQFSVSCPSSWSVATDTKTSSTTSSSTTSGSMQRCAPCL